MESPSTPPAADLDNKELKNYVKNALDNLQKGQYFTEFGLSEDVQLLPGDELPDPRQDHPFNQFLSVVSTGMLKKRGLTKGRKKFMRMVEERLHSFGIKRWKTWMSKSRTSGNSTMVAKFEESANPEATETSTDKMEIDEDTEKDVSKKRKADALNDGDNDSREDKPNTAMDDEGEENTIEEDDQPSNEQEVVVPRTDEKYLKKKAEFEKERDGVLAGVPDHVKARFGEVCFAKWGKQILPALVLSPYSVAPGGVRDIWFEMYSKVTKSGRVDNMTNLVYWYGSYEDPLNAYSLVTNTNLLSYEEGAKKGLVAVPKAVAKKVKEGTQLNAAQLLAVRGREEMAEDLKKAPELRRGRMDPFQEMYEIDSDDDLQADADAAERASGPNRKRQKKAGKKSGDADDDLGDEDPKSQKRRGRPKGSKNLPKVKSKDPGNEAVPKKKLSKKSLKQGGEEAESKGDAAIDAVTKADATLGNTIDADEVAEPVTGMVGDVGDVGDDDIPSDNDKDDEDAEIESESDQADLDFDPEDISPKSKSKAKKSKVKESAEASDLPKKKKGRPPKSDKKIAATDQVDDEQTRLDAEKKLFRKCEKDYRGLIQSWESALQMEDNAKIELILKELLKHVDKFSAPFIEEYKLNILIKSTKKVCECENRKELFRQMKEQYIAKRNLVPPGFKIKKKDSLPIQKKVLKAPSPLGGEDGDDAANKDKTLPATEDTPNEGDGDAADNLDTAAPDSAVANSLANPIKRSGSVERIEPQPDKSEQNMTSPLKGEKKKLGASFSLGKLFKPESKEIKTKLKAERQSIPSSQKLQQQSFPRWLGEAPKEVIPSDKAREFALEFLQQAAPTIPPSKHVNHDAVARSLEFAIYSWAKESPVGDKYWNKIHDIVASISGNHKPGTLSTLIGEGRFHSPLDLMELSDDDLLSSFEGRPLTL